MSDPHPLYPKLMNVLLDLDTRDFQVPREQRYEAMARYLDIANPEKKAAKKTERP